MNARLYFPKLPLPAFTTFEIKLADKLLPAVNGATAVTKE